MPALVTGLLNFIESFLCAKMFAARYGETVSPNREMVAIGLANAVSSFFGTFPASASLSRTTLAAQNGAQTPAAGFFSALVVAFGIAFLLPLIAKLPVCVASAMICDAVFYVIDFHELVMLVRMRLWQDVALFLTIFFGTLQFGVDDSIFLALGGCMMLLVRSVAVIQPKIVVLGRLSTESVRLKSERFRKARELHEERKEKANTTDGGDDAGSVSLLDNVSSLFLLKKYDSKHGRGAATLTASADDGGDDEHDDESGDQVSQLRPQVRSVREQRFLGLSSSTSARRSSLSSSVSSSIDASVAMEFPHDMAPSSSASSRRLAFEYVDITEFPQAQSVPGVLMVKLSGALNFATIGRIQLLFRRFLAPVETDAPASEEMGLAASDADEIVQLGRCKNSDTEDVAIDMVEVISLDGSAVSVFVALLREALLGGRRVCLGGLRENVLKLLLRIPEFRRIMRGMLYATLHEAVTALE